MVLTSSPNAVAAQGTSRALHARFYHADIALSARGAALPDEIAFLAPQDCSIGALLQAAAEARRLNMNAPAVLIASGAISDERYYAALARRLGLPFCNCPGSLGPGQGSPQAALAGIARLLPGSTDMLMAPEGPAIAALLAMQQRGGLPRGRMTLTTPRRFSAWAQRSAGAPIAAEASKALSRFDPALSASMGLSRTQIVVGAALACIALVAFFASSLAWFILCQCLGFIMAAGVFVRLLAISGARDAPVYSPRHLRDADLPIYTVMAPLYREAEGAAKLVAALERLDYPRAKLDIKIIVEDEDVATREAFEALALPAYFQIIVAPPGAPRTKPRALNIALPFARGALTTIYDAEDEPEPDQLRLAAMRFAQGAADLGCLQARLAIDNSGDSWLAALFAIEYAALFDVINPGLAAYNLPMPLGGTSNHFRTQALRESFGWDAWNVTEDADLGVRLARFGYRVEALTSTTFEEAPAKVSAWLAQRRRWQKGWTQTFLTVTRDPPRLVRELGFWRATSAILQLSAGVLGPLLGPVLMLVTIREAVVGNLLHPVTWLEIFASTMWVSTFIMCVVSILWPAFLGIARRDLGREARFLPLLPLYYALMSYASWRALIELARNPYSWSKTRHGLARTSRRRDGAGKPAAASPINLATQRD